MKLHPGETDEGPYRAVVDGSRRRPRVRAAADDVVQPVDLYRLLRAADAHIGIQSTVLTEAVAAGHAEPARRHAGGVGPAGLRRGRRGRPGPQRRGPPGRPRCRPGAITPGARSAFLARISAKAARASVSAATSWRGSRERADAVPHPCPRRQPADPREEPAEPRRDPARGLGRPDRRGCGHARRRRRLLDGPPGDRGRRVDLGRSVSSRDLPPSPPTPRPRSRSRSTPSTLWPPTVRRSDLLALVQPTSPLTDPADLRAAIGLARETGRSVASVTVSHPAAWHHGVADESPPPSGRRGCRPPAHRRVLRDDPDALRRSGRFVEPGVTLGYTTPRERAVDIDEPADLAVAAALLGTRRSRRSASPAARSVPPEAASSSSPRRASTTTATPTIAHRLVDAAADTGADAVKFQTFVPDALASAAAPTAAYQRAAGEGDGPAGDARSGSPCRRTPGPRSGTRPRSRHRLPVDAVRRRLGRPPRRARRPGVQGRLGRAHQPAVPRAAGPTRPPDARLDRHGDDGRGRRSGRRDPRGRDSPSWRCSTASRATRPRRRTRTCAAMRTMREAFGLPTGWSDHTPGTELPIAATALGATIIEKHLTLDRIAPRAGPRDVARADRVRGDGRGDPSHGRRARRRRQGPDRRPSARSRPSRGAACTGLATCPRARPSRRATSLAQRPGTGISPARMHELVGRPTARPVRAGAMVEEGDA